MPMQTERGGGSTAPTHSQGVGGHHQPSAALPPGKTRYPLYRRLPVPGEILGGYGKSRAIGIRPRKVQPAASRCTHY